MTVMRKPAAPVVKLKPQTHAELQAIAKEQDRSMGDVVASLIQHYRKEQFWERARISVERLKADPVAWQGYLDEIAEWDTLAGDGLENEEPYYTPEEETEIEEEYTRTYGR